MTTCYELNSDTQAILAVRAEVPAGWSWRPRLNAAWLARVARVSLRNFIATKPVSQVEFGLN
jgi:hypothetical protein